MKVDRKRCRRIYRSAIKLLRRHGLLKLPTSPSPRRVQALMCLEATIVDLVELDENDD